MFVERTVSIDRNTRRVLLLSLVLFVAFTVYLSLLYQRNLLHGTDFGRYVHMFATTVHGSGFLDSGIYRIYLPQDTYWGRHFTLTLLLYLPFYALFPSPYTLIVAKSFVVAASVPMLWLLARTSLDDDRLAGLVVVSYAANPFLWSAWSFEFQEQIIVPLLVFATHYFYTRERHGSFLVLLFLALVTNEYMVLFVGGYLLALTISAYRTDTLRQRRVPIAMGFVLTAVAKVVSSTVKSMFSLQTGIAKLRLAGPVLSHVEGPNTSVGELAKIILTDPLLVPELLTIDATQKLLFFLALLAPVLFLALRDEVTLLALAPWLGFAWLFDGTGATYLFRGHYPFYILPFVYIGAVRVLDRYSGRIPRLTRTGFAVFLAVVLVMSLATGLVTGGGNMQALPPDSDHNRRLDAAIDAIPEDATLVTQNSIYPKVATRPNATFVTSAKNFRRYEDRYGTVTPEYVLYDERLDWLHQIKGAFGDRLGTEYGLYMKGDGIYVWKHGYEGEPKSIPTDDATTSDSNTTESNSAGGPSVTPTNRARIPPSIDITDCERRCSSAPECVYGVLFCRLPRWINPREDAGGDAERESEDHVLHVDGLEGDHRVAECDLVEDDAGDEREQPPDDAADDAEETGLEQEETHHARPRDADGAHHADLLSAFHDAHQHDVQDAETRDDQGDGADAEEEDVEDGEEPGEAVDDRSRVVHPDAVFLLVHGPLDLVSRGCRLLVGFGGDHHPGVVFTPDPVLWDDDGFVRREARRLLGFEDRDDLVLLLVDDDGVSDARVHVVRDGGAQDRPRLQRHRNGSCLGRVQFPWLLHPIDGEELSSPLHLDERPNTLDRDDGRVASGAPNLVDVSR